MQKEFLGRMQHQEREDSQLVDVLRTQQHYVFIAGKSLQHFLDNRLLSIYEIRKRQLKINSFFQSFISIERSRKWEHTFNDIW
jgi:hypothetical protein